MKRAHPQLMNARRMAPFTRLNRFCFICVLLGCGVAKYGLAQADANPKETTEQTMERLMAATAQLQAQMEANQKQMAELQRQLAALRQQIAAEKAGAPSTATA